MTTLAPTPGSRATRRLEVEDLQADQGRRLVMVAPDRVVIMRYVQGVFMRVALASGAYAGVALRLLALDDLGFQFEIRLAHADADLGVSLAKCRAETEAEIVWRRWARFLDLPMLVERNEGVLQRAGPILANDAVRSPAFRRKRHGLGPRRARFLTRRKVGRPELCAPVGAILEFSGGPR